MDGLCKLCGQYTDYPYCGSVTNVVNNKMIYCNRFSVRKNYKEVPKMKTVYVASVLEEFDASKSKLIQWKVVGVFNSYDEASDFLDTFKDVDSTLIQPFEIKEV